MPRIPPVVLRWSSAWLEALEALVFPMSCLVCDADGHDGPFCPDCRAEFLAASEGACPRCALSCGPYALATSRGPRPGCAWCRGRPLGFDAAVALGPYQGPIREACLRLKRHSGAWLATWLADLLVDAHGARLMSEDVLGTRSPTGGRRGEGSSSGQAEARRPATTAHPTPLPREESAGRENGDGRSGGEADPWVVPVPLHWIRRHRRGYNQAEALARRVAARLQWPFRQPLRRVVATGHLADLGRRERAEALRHAFQARATPDLKGRRILLVDDILTTGATSGAAARALKRAGASRVVVAVVGRAEGAR